VRGWAHAVWDDEQSQLETERGAWSTGARAAVVVVVVVVVGVVVVAPSHLQMPHYECRVAIRP
jgi:hypothetical protein